MALVANITVIVVLKNAILAKWFGIAVAVCAPATLSRVQCIVFAVSADLSSSGGVPTNRLEIIVALAAGLTVIVVLENAIITQRRRRCSGLLDFPPFQEWHTKVLCVSGRPLGAAAAIFRAKYILFTVAAHGRRSYSGARSARGTW